MFWTKLSDQKHLFFNLKFFILNVSLQKIFQNHWKIIEEIWFICSRYCRLKIFRLFYVKIFTAIWTRLLLALVCPSVISFEQTQQIKTRKHSCKIGYHVRFAQFLILHRTWTSNLSCFTKTESFARFSTMLIDPTDFYKYFQKNNLVVIRVNFVWKLLKVLSITLYSTIVTGRTLLFDMNVLFLTARCMKIEITIRTLQKATVFTTFWRILTCVTSSTLKTYNYLIFRWWHLNK